MGINEELYKCDECGWSGTWNDIPNRYIDFYYDGDIDDDVMIIYCPKCKNQIYDGGKDCEDN